MTQQQAKPDEVEQRDDMNGAAQGAEFDENGNRRMNQDQERFGGETRFARGQQQAQPDEDQARQQDIRENQQA